MALVGVEVVGSERGDTGVQGAQLAGPALDEAGGRNGIHLVPLLLGFTLDQAGQPFHGVEAGGGRGEGHRLGAVGVRAQQAGQGAPGLVGRAVLGVLGVVAGATLGIARHGGAGEHDRALVQAAGRRRGRETAGAARGHEQDQRADGQQQRQDGARREGAGHGRPGQGQPDGQPQQGGVPGAAHGGALALAAGFESQPGAQGGAGDGDAGQDQGHVNLLPGNVVGPGRAGQGNPAGARLEWTVSIC